MSRSAVEDESTNPRGKFVVVTLILAAFGPYVAGSVRTEQVAVYGLLALTLATAPTIRAHSLRGAAAWRLASTWTLYAAVAAAASVGSLAAPPRWAQGPLLAGLDNVVAPLAVMLLVWLSVDPRRAEDWLRLASKLIAVGMATNGVLALVMTQVDLSALLRPFWSATGGVTTAQLAAGLGRVSGVFNHPAEAGVAYGLAGVCAWYVWRDRPTRLYLLLLPIVLGGLVSVSKVFVLGALPIILWLIWQSRGNGSRGGLLFVAGSAAFGVLQSGFAAQWTGLSYLGAILSPGDQDAIAFFTAGRVGAGSTLISVLEEVARIDPLVGVGAKGLSVPYDNGWVEAFVVAGVVGVVCYTAALAWMWLAGRVDPDPARRRLVLAVTLIAAGGSLGLPSLTANRVSTLLWVVVALAVAASTHDRQAASDRWSRQYPAGVAGTGGLPVVVAGAGQAQGAGRGGDYALG